MPFASPALFETERLLIRLVEEEDIPELFKTNGDDVVTKFLPYDTWQSVEDGKLWYEKICKLHTTKTVLQFVIINKDSDRVIGSCLLFHLQEASRRAEIGYVLGREFWRHGFAYEALTGLLCYAFEDCALHRLEAEIHPDNLASNNLILKLGFTCEGLLRQRWYSKGKFVDTKIYGLLNKEYKTTS
jgi:[ribosomal protein S5]-alanine N-acetyltransferase